MQCQEAAARLLLSDTLDHREADLKVIPRLKIKKKKKKLFWVYLSFALSAAPRDAYMLVDIISSDMLIAALVTVF